VDDVSAAVKQLTSAEGGGLTAIDPVPKIGAHGKPVVFLHPKSLNGVLVELEQK
jgi:methylmalonyl-CoA/ethylmalonyl-CoA epimerase